MHLSRRLATARNTEEERTRAQTESLFPLLAAVQLPLRANGSQSLRTHDIRPTGPT